MSRRLSHYMKLEYPISMVVRDDIYEVEFPDLKGCVAHGKTANTAYKKALEAKEAWLRAAIARGIEIPEPSKDDILDFSGRILVRCSRALHKDLVSLAKDEGVSLNHLITAALTAYVAGREAFQAGWARAKDDLIFTKILASSFGNEVSVERKAPPSSGKTVKKTIPLSV